MDKTQLETFLLIAEHKSYSKAATFLNVTQPTITARMKNLENELSCQLFNRVGKNILLSEEGTLFVDYAENILLYMNQSKKLGEQSNNITIKIGFSPGYSYSFITELLASMKTIEDVNLTIVEGKDSCDLNEQVIAGELDLAFTRNIQSHRPEIVTEYLFDNKLAFVIGATHPLAEKQSLTLQDLEHETLVSYRRHSTLWKEIDQLLIGIPNIKRLDVDNNEMLKKVVESGLGVGITPILGIDSSKENQLIVRELKELSKIVNKVYVQYKKNSATAKPIKKIIYSIINHRVMAYA